MLWITGIACNVEHCQHCNPNVFWLENEEGKAPQFAFRGFPTDGQVVMSKATMIVVCSACSLPQA